MSTNQQIAFEIIEKLTEYVESIDEPKSCQNCEYWRHTEDKCGMWNMLPPPKVLFDGCDKHEYEIPF